MSTFLHGQNGKKLPKLSQPANASQISKGYDAIGQNGNRIVGTLNVLNTNDATATANTILSGYSAYARGSKINGNVRVTIQPDGGSVAISTILSKSLTCPTVTLTSTGDGGLVKGYTDFTYYKVLQSGTFHVSGTMEGYYFYGKGEKHRWTISGVEIQVNNSVVFDKYNKDKDRNNYSLNISCNQGDTLKIGAYTAIDFYWGGVTITDTAYGATVKMECARLFSSPITFGEVFQQI